MAIQRPDQQVLHFFHSLCNPKRREFLGRDGIRWAKLGTFYFFFYLGLGAFFCLMLGVFMAVTPHHHPRYVGESSTMNAGSQPLSPGLGFRPHLDPESHLIVVNKSSNPNELNIHATNLDDYIRHHYPSVKLNETTKENFLIADPGDCRAEKQYGFLMGKPCILIKMNKVFGFQPIPGYRADERDAFMEAGCSQSPKTIAIHCYGEYLADADHIGNITYISENSRDDHCGSLDTKWFPYRGKKINAIADPVPYIWVQFINPKPNTLIDVVCRLFAENIYFHKIRSQASTRFQLYINDRSI